MPYVTQATRDYLATESEGPANGGELNYVCSVLVDRYFAQHGISYDTINTVMGVLACMRAEIYRRIAAPYEDTKITENGEVFTCLSST